MSTKLFKIMIVSFLLLFVADIDGQAADRPIGADSDFIVTGGLDFDDELISSGEDFIFPQSLPKGYQTTAKITAVFKDSNGAQVTIPDGSVSWTIESVENIAKAWNRAPGDMSGLSWGDAEVDGTTAWTSNTVLGAPTSDATVYLTDVVGERIVALKAEATIGGAAYSGTAAATFGKGPLSVFTTPPVVGKQWARSAGNAATQDEDWAQGNFLVLDGADSNDFPAAVGVCGGTVDVSAIKSNFLGSSHSFTFTTGSSWRVGDRFSDHYYSTTSKLPTLGQLTAVSAYSEYHPNVKRKGAALAAGWPDDVGNEGLYSYWTGQVLFGSDGYFDADFVSLSYGDDSYWFYVTYATPVVVCVK
jgi:hypothetical protein